MPAPAIPPSAPISIPTIDLSVLGSTVQTGGTVTASSPLIDMVQTWNNAAVAFTGLRFNFTDTASNFSSYVLDIKVNNSSVFSVRKDAQAYIFGNAIVSSSISFGGNLSSSADASIITLGAASDIRIVRDAANTLALRNGTAAQQFNLYETYTDAANYGRLILKFSGSVAYIQTDGAGTGSARPLAFYVQGIEPMRLTGTGVSFGSTVTFGTDNAYDIGASGANRPRNVYVGGNIIFGAGGFLFGGGVGIGYNAPGQLNLTSTGLLGWSSTTSQGANDTVLLRDAANTLALRNGTAAQTFNVYNTYTDGANYEALRQIWSGNRFYIQAFAAGTGIVRDISINPATNLYITGNIISTSDNTYDIGASGANRPRNVYVAGYVSSQASGYGFNNSGGASMGMYASGSTLAFAVAATNRIVFQDSGGTNFFTMKDSFLQFSGTTNLFPALKRSTTQIKVRLADDSGDASLTASYVQTVPLTVATLPAAATAGAGARSFVTDATVTMAAGIGTVVVGGGSNKVPVYSDSSSWLVG